MEQPEHNTSAAMTWLLILGMVGWVLFKGWLAFTVIGDPGPPDWDFAPIKDVPGESAYTISNPYQPLPNAQHVLKEQGHEKNPSHLKALPFQGVE